MADPVLMFGVGAAKSGTSWLRDYLSRHPECHLRSIKELHFFDTAEAGNRTWYLNDLVRKAADLEARMAGDDRAAPAWQVVQVAELRLYARVLEKGDTDGYLAFLLEGRTGERLVGDITPGYALLSEETLTRMAGLHSDVRFVFVMRDPVERLWSHVRMVARRRAPDGDPRRRAARILDNVFAGREDHIAARGDYRGALTRLRAAVAPEKLFVCTYEDLFAGGALARLCGFLGIAALPGDPARRVHAGAAIAMTERQRQRAAAWLRPQYDYVAANMGALPPAWQASLAGI